MKQWHRRIVSAALAVAGISLLGTSQVQAQTFPDRAVRLIVGFPPGGSGDFIARVLAQPLAEELGQPVIVDNRPGAGSNIATTAVARAEPDGYTLLLGGNFSHGVNPTLFKKVNFDPVNDFTPITKVTDLPVIVAVRSATGIQTLQELLERIKTEPGKWDYATPGNGTPSHLAGEQLKKYGGIDVTHIPFRGSGPAMQAVLGGDIPLTIGTPPVILPQVMAGTLTALSVTTRERVPVIPDIPGTREAGLPDLNLQGWWGLWAPAGIPTQARDRLFEAMTRVLALSDVKERLAKEGLHVTPSASPDAFEAYVKEEIPFWRDVVLQTGVVVD